MAVIYDARQLSFKIVSNSVYGVCGATKGPLVCVPIASTVTSIGRSMIVETKTLIEDWYEGSEVIYGDTDSVFVKFPHHMSAIEAGKEAAARVSHHFGHPINLTFEKVFQPMLLLNKKRYAGVVNGHLSYKGLQLVRRDSCPLLRKTYQETLDLLLIQNNVEKAKKHADNVMENIKNVELSDLCLSKSIKVDAKELLQQINRNECHSYKNMAAAHIQAAVKLERAYPGAGPKAGERIEFVYVKGEERRVSDRALHPSMVFLDMVDYDYYISNIIGPPLKDLLQYCVVSTKE
jgi:DNA polymerase delta subunit 1